MMISVDNRIDELISRVKARGGMEGFAFLPAYPPHKTPYPVRKYTVAVESRETHDSAIFIGDKVGGSERGRLVEADLRMRVYAPQESSGTALLRASSMVADTLIKSDFDGILRSVSMSGIEYDTSAHSEYRDINAVLRIIIEEEEPDERA